MLFRSPSSLVSPFSFPIGERLEIGVDASFWVGSFGGIQNGVVLLTNAQLFANVGKPIDGISPLVRIPIRFITFVSPKDKEECKDNEDHKDNEECKDKDDHKKGHDKKGLKKLKFW